ncbi:hypothetical protein ABZZ79_26905 [Streptomyces sp. NPDC006458]|uniref:F0F1 ATP synthase subunit B family protein n=1 Tax=Streptomyces sp. NPDC006458 TaxID=3154302 RepID=UPI0033A870AE
MELIPWNIGPLNPRLPELIVALLLFTCCYAATARLLRRMNHVLEERERATDGADREAEQIRAQAEATREEALTLLAAARHDAARLRQQAREQGAALIAGARADALRERDAFLAESTARLDADRAAAEAELRLHVPDLAGRLAGSLVGEPPADLQRTS